MAARMSPRTAAGAFLIWRDCQDFGWDRTMADIAASVDMTTGRVNRILGLAGWRNRVRKTSQYDGLVPSSVATDEEAAELSAGLLPRRLLAAE